MASTIEDLGNSMQKLTVTVEREAFAEAMKKSFQKNKNRFSVPGFRKGKAPMNIVCNYYGEGVLYDDAVDAALQPAYEEALKEHDIKPFSRPDVDITSIGSDKGMEFTCEFAVKPEVKLGEYLGVSAYRPPVEVKEEEIDAQIDSDRLRASRLVPVEREVKEDDLVTMDYKGSIDDVPFEGGSAENYDLTIGSGSFIPGFEDQMIGRKKGESFDIHVTFPEEYHSEDLQGKEAVFNVTIHEIKEREMPELDDEFVKDITEDCDTVEEYRAKIRADKEKVANERADSELEENAVAAAVKNAEVEIPEAAIRDEIEDVLQEQRQQMAYQGLRLEDYLQYLNIDINIFKLQLREPAEIRLRNRLVLEAIAQAENLEVSEEDITKHFVEMAKVYGSDAETIRKSFTDENLEALKEGMLIRKSSELLREKAAVTDVKPEPEHEHDHEEDHEHDGECEHEHDDEGEHEHEEQETAEKE